MIKKGRFLIILLICFLSLSSIKVIAEDLSELAVAFYSDNDIEKALETLNKIPDEEKMALDFLLLGNIYDENGQKNEAINFYKKSIKIDNKYYKSYYNIANMYADNKDYHAAIYYYKLALKYNKNNAYINYNLGYAYLKIGDLKNANSEFKNAIKIKNDMPEAYYNLAYTYKRLGNKKLVNSNLEIYNKLVSLH